VIERMADKHDDAIDLADSLSRLGKPLAIGHFAPGVIHELNNPLFAVLGLLEFLVTDTEPGTKAHHRLTLIQQSALEIREIVRVVLDFARERGDDDAEHDLAEIAGAAVALFRRTSVARDLETQVVASDGTVAVLGSRNRLVQVFLALLTNAELAMPEGGSIAVEVLPEGARVVATVTDGGCGVDPSIRPRIFEPFFTTRASTGASGVGLTIARAICSQHGGELELARTGPAGSSFVVRLPAV
jgi:two-component system C4-dicarboxylate transport sensor histidine kinase DctB